MIAPLPYGLLNTTFGRALEGSKHDIQYFHKNNLDHVCAFSDGRGDIIEHYHYSAFGESEFYNESGEQLAGSAIDNDILWNVKRYSEFRGLYLYIYLYRHYDTGHGRWPSRDLIMEQSGVNLNGFVGKSPYSFYDYLGAKPKPKVEALIAAAEAAFYAAVPGSEFAAALKVFNGCNSLGLGIAYIKRRWTECVGCKGFDGPECEALEQNHKFLTEVYDNQC